MIAEFNDYGKLKEEFSGGEYARLLGIYSVDDKELENIKKVLNEYPQEQIYLAFAQQDQIKKVLKNINVEKIYILNNFGDYDCSNCFSSEDYKYIYENYKNISFISYNRQNEHHYYADDRRRIISPKDMFEQEKIVEMVVKEVKETNLSPAEKYAYLYNIVKRYKKYCHHPEEKNGEFEAEIDSRHPQLTLLNNYIVCEGFATLLKKFVDKLNDPNIEVFVYALDVDCVDGRSAGHARCLVNLKDDKYGICNFYMSDPTWDNILEKDFYNFFLLTNDELNDDKKIKHDSPTTTDIIFGNNKFTIKDIPGFTYDYAFDLMYTMFGERIDYKDYPNYIKPFSQEEIECDTLREIIKNVYSKIYVCDGDELNAIVEKTMLENNERQKDRFDKYGNKFDSKNKTI